MAARRARLALLLIGAVALLLGHDAHAQTCCPVGTTCHLASGWPACGPSGCVTLDAATVGATGSAPAPDTGFNPGGLATGHSYAITGKKLVGINNADGSTLFSTQPSTATLDNFPNPVILTSDCVGMNCASSTKTTMFVGADDGSVYKVVYNASGGTTTTTSVNLQRPGCSLDKIKGTPSVQLNRYSDSSFQTAMGGTTVDLVIVGTYYPDQGGACPGGQNRVYGLRSSDLSIKWVYNQAAGTVLQEVSEACPLEYYGGPTPAGTVNNTALCGFNKTGASDGLVALNTTTGTPRWAADTAGGVINRPVIATLNGRRAVYVGTSNGYLRAHDPTSGALFWTGGTPLVPGGIAQNIWAEFRAGQLANRIFVVGMDGTLWRFLDNGTSGFQEGWGLVADQTGAVKYTSMPVIDPVGAMYIGRNDGRVQQISAVSTQQETQVVGGPTSIVYDPALDIAPDGTVTQLVVTASGSGTTPGKIARLQLYWCSTPNGATAACGFTSDAACNGYANPVTGSQYEACRASACDGSTCMAPVASPDGTPCDDGSSCSLAYPVALGCPSNKCVGGSNSGANCTSDGQCPGGTCFMNRCVGGPTPSAPCLNNSQCVGSGVRGNCTKQLFAPKTLTLCDSGAEAGNHCKLVCVGGIAAGYPCARDTDCFDGTAGTCPEIPSSTDCPPAGRCQVWGPSPSGDGSCTATQDTPFCNTIFDCPTTRYCALDPKNFIGVSQICTNNLYGDPPPTALDDCCMGGTSMGPCLSYGACINNRCTRTTQGNFTVSCGTSTYLAYGESSCKGGPTGAGGAYGNACTTDLECQGQKCVGGRCLGSCNNVCKQGRCTSNSYANCSCESAGDRACTLGQTCCGFQGTCKRFGDSCSVDTDCCSNSCEGNVCAQPALTCKRWGTPCSTGLECCSQTCTLGKCTQVPPGTYCYDLNVDQHHCGSCDFDCGSYACVNGVCQGPAGSSCTDVPTNAQILAAGSSGATSIAFEHTNLNQSAGAQKCGAWMSKAPTVSSGQMVRVGAAGFQTYSTATSMLLGISPACQGDAATTFSCGSNAAEIVLATYPSSTVTPIARYTAPAITADAAGTAPTSLPGSGPFLVSAYNSGPVGPAFDWKTYDGTTTNRVAYWANWNANGDVKKVSGPSWTVSAAPVVSPNPLPERVNAIAFGRRDYYWKSTSNGSQKKQKANSLYIGHGSKLTIVNIDTPPPGYMINPSDPMQIDINLATACEATSCSLRCDGGSHNGVICTSPTDANCTAFGGLCSTTKYCFGPHGGNTCTSLADCHGCGPEAPTAIESIAPHPVNDFLLLVARGTADTFIIEVRPRPRTARKGIDFQDELAVSDPVNCPPPGSGDIPVTCATCPAYSCIPTAVNTLDAKLAFDPFGNVVWIGLGNTLGSALQSVQNYTASP